MVILFQSRRRGAVLAMLLAVLAGVGGCSNQAGQAAGNGGEPEKVTDLVGEFGEAGAAHGKVKYTVERTGDAVMREFEVEIEGGTPGDLYEITLNGARIGAATIDAEGEGELELEDGSELPFPAGFAEPADGAVVKVGRFEVTLRSRP